MLGMASSCAVSVNVVFHASLSLFTLVALPLSLVKIVKM